MTFSSWMASSKLLEVEGKLEPPSEAWQQARTLLATAQYITETALRQHNFGARVRALPDDISLRVAGGAEE